MNTIDEEQLMALAFDELPAADAERLRDALATDPALAARYAKLQDDLLGFAHAEAPARDELYGRRIWAKVQPALAPRGAASRRMTPWPWAIVASLALVAVLAYQLGRSELVAPIPEEGATVAATTPPGRSAASQRVLAASVADHLQGTERLLLEIANRNPDAEIDIEAERQWASILLTANRLYRYAAEQAGQARVAQVLEDMEPVLIQLANGDGEDASDELMGLRRSIEQRDLIFKARTTEVQL